MGQLRDYETTDNKNYSQLRREPLKVANFDKTSSHYPRASFLTLYYIKKLKSCQEHLIIPTSLPKTTPSSTHRIRRHKGPLLNTAFPRCTLHREIPTAAPPATRRAGAERRGAAVGAAAAAAAKRAMAAAPARAAPAPAAAGRGAVVAARAGTHGRTLRASERCDPDSYVSGNRRNGGVCLPRMESD